MNRTGILGGVFRGLAGLRRGLSAALFAGVPELARPGWLARIGLDPAAMAAVALFPRSRGDGADPRSGITSAEPVTSFSLPHSREPIAVRRSLALASLLILAIAVPAAADWPAGGRHVSTFWADYGVRDARIFDLPSGDLGVLAVGKGGNVNNFNLQRIRRAGDIAAGWPASGVDFLSVIVGTVLNRQSIVPDDSGSVWHAWSASGVKAEFIDRDGVRSPSGSPGYMALGTGSLAAHAAPAPAGGAYATRAGNRLVRITRTGAYPAGWTSTGITLPGYEHDDHALFADGHGGVVVFMRFDATGRPVATRIDSNRVVHAGWPAGGLALGAVLPDPMSNYDSALLASGPEHFIAGWWSQTAPSTGQIRVQRFGLDGTLDPAWPPEGVAANVPGPLAALTFIPDAAGGVYVLWQASGVPIATHVSSTGEIVGGMGVNLLDDGAQYVPTYVQAHPGIPDRIIADATASGGLLVGWGDTRLAPTISFRLRWLLADLTPDPDMPDSGRVVFPVSPYTGAGSMLAVHSDGDDAAFVAWAGYSTVDTPNGQLWMTHVPAPAVLDVATPARPASGLALSAPRPNPARGVVTLDLTLPNNEGARIELIDVAGRIWRTRRVQGAGAHHLEFRDLESIPQGLYFVRAATRTGTSSARVVLGR